MDFCLSKVSAAIPDGEKVYYKLTAEPPSDISMFKISDDAWISSAHSLSTGKRVYNLIVTATNSQRTRLKREAYATILVEPSPYFGPPIFAHVPEAIRVASNVRPTDTIYTVFATGTVK